MDQGDGTLHTVASAVFFILIRGYFSLARRVRLACGVSHTFETSALDAQNRGMAVSMAINQHASYPATIQIVPFELSRSIGFRGARIILLPSDKRLENMPTTKPNTRTTTNDTGPPLVPLSDITSIPTSRADISPPFFNDLHAFGPQPSRDLHIFRDCRYTKAYKNAPIPPIGQCQR